jgi:predicted nucleic acid-binding Zn ribbon protein
MRILRDILKEMVGRYHWHPAEVLMEIESVWPAVVGDPLARVARPIGFVDGVLTVSVPAPVWGQELWYVRSALMERLNAELSAGRVTHLRFVVRPLGSSEVDAERRRDAVAQLERLAEEIRPGG